MTLSFDEVLARFGPWKQTGHNYRVSCPAHNDGTPSLDIAEGDHGPLFICRSRHCQTGDILSAVGLTWADILPTPINGHREVWDHIYEYKDRAGTLRYSVLRRDATGTQEKRISQRAANGDWGTKGITPLPYRLPELEGSTLLVAEGEKAVDALWAAGFPATTNSGGAGNWRDTDTQALQAIGITSLVILPDNDEAGAKHAAKVELSAAKHGITTRRAILPGLPPGGDAADWLTTHTADDLEAALQPPPPPLLPGLIDSIDVAAEGRKIQDEGIQYVIEGIVPDYGMVGFIVAAAKVGKSSLGLALAQAVATGGEFLGRAVQQRRVLVIAAEDPPEYVAWMARHLTAPKGWITFARGPLQLNAEGLERIANTIAHGRYGLVLIASWQAVITSMVKDENDNAGSVVVVENVKRTAHASHVPWMVDAHAGKSEDQSDDADPTKALRGASSAAGAADFLLSLRYLEKGSFSTKRRLSGKGRFVNLETVTIEYDTQTGRYDIAAESSKTAAKSAMAETTWQMILETGALDQEWSGVGTIAVRAGLCDSSHGIKPSVRKKVWDALYKRPGVGYWRDEKHNNRPMFRLGGEDPPP